MVESNILLSKKFDILVYEEDSTGNETRIETNKLGQVYGKFFTNLEHIFELQQT